MLSVASRLRYTTQRIMKEKRQEGGVKFDEKKKSDRKVYGSYRSRSLDLNANDQDGKTTSENKEQKIKDEAKYCSASGETDRPKLRSGGKSKA